MILTTTNAVEGRNVARYLGIVSGEAVMGANLVKDILAGITDIVGGRSGAYEKEFRTAKDIAIGDMVAEAKALGANAIIGIDLDYEVVSGSNTMLMVSANGTAVELV